MSSVCCNETDALHSTMKHHRLAGYLSGRLFFNKISRKYKAETNYPIARKVRTKTVHKKKIDNFSPPELGRKLEGVKTFAHCCVKTKRLIT